MHVAVLGAGYAGVTLTRLLERRLPADVEITLVDESPDHLVQHELHRVVRRPALANEITVSLTDVVDRATVEVATVEGIDRETRTVDLSSGTLSYDVAVVCLGAETAFHGLADVRERATPLKRLAHARQIRREFFDAIETDEPRIVVGGAGLSGVQVAGELAELAREEGVADRTTVTILERLDAVAPGFSPRFQRAVRRSLERLGVEIRTGTTVTGADEGAIRVEGGGSIPFDQLVWTGGIRGSDALAGDRPTVNADLRLDERTFVCGDAARVIDDDGETVPASAQSAVREARTVAKNVATVLERGRPGSEEIEAHLEHFRFRSPGWLVSVGDDAVAKVGPMILTGRAAKAMKATVGAGYLSSIGGYREAVGLTYAELVAEAVDRPYR
ncbi:NAD(P)/FAD-dependent oxidoreductase [Halovivax sp.]|uniref:NAD(P)/FAD-dependent oxidoreductase n=1 Tax=Halovivax sp. TaxID=1935978 RepID=UPI0025BB84CA|nr:FAD-dependent oxidoreductase [Halovivax sp.]